MITMTIQVYKTYFKFVYLTTVNITQTSFRSVGMLAYTLQL